MEKMMPKTHPERILTIDIGGTGIKAGLLYKDGTFLAPPRRCPSPKNSPQQMLAAIADLADGIGDFDAISIGFPGSIKHHTILTAPNLGSEAWRGTNFSALVESHFQRPTKLVNDATLHGLGIISEHGLEVVLTLGTGMGFALFLNGVPAPQIELGRHTAGEEPSYDEFVGNAALQKLGEEHWKQRVQEAIQRIARLVNFDTLYLGGGNARLFSDAELPDSVKRADNEAGLTGGVKLWHDNIEAVLT